MVAIKMGRSAILIAVIIAIIIDHRKPTRIAIGRRVMITRYAFGMMEIDGEVYRKDLMILPDGSIHHPWWRASGHVLTAVDIQPILAVSPRALVVGTGNPGLMKPDAEFSQAVESQGINLSVLSTAQAVQRFNRMSTQGESCAACFHLTC